MVSMTGGLAASVNEVGARQRARLEQRLFALIGREASPPSYATSGGWRVQVGTFRSRDTALSRIDAIVRSVPELATAGAETSSYGRLTRSRFVGLPDEASAKAICAKVTAGGVGCYVLPPR